MTYKVQFLIKIFYSASILQLPLLFFCFVAQKSGLEGDEREREWRDLTAT